MAEKNKGKKYQYLLFGLCSLLAMAVCMAVLVVTVRNVEGSSTAAVEYETASKTEITGDTAELLSYLKALTQETCDNRFIKTDTYTDISVDDASVEICGNGDGTDKSLFTYAKNKMLGTVDGYYPEDYKGIFGTVYKNMPVIDLSASLVADSRFSVGEADGDGNPVYDTDTGELLDGDYYFITLTLDESAAEEPSVAALFSLDGRAEIYERLKADLQAVCSIEGCEISIKALNVYAKINRLTDEIQYLNFEKAYKISTVVTFEDKLQVFGTKELEFEYRVNEKYEYKYVGIRFAEDSVTVAPGGETALTVSAVIENDSEYTVTFASSDESVVTIDEMGYVTGIKKSDTPVTVTVRLEYLGEIFTDECTVTVSDNEN